MFTFEISLPRCLQPPVTSATCIISRQLDCTHSRLNARHCIHMSDALHEGLPLLHMHLMREIFNIISEPDGADWLDSLHHWQGPHKPQHLANQLRVVRAKCTHGTGRRRLRHRRPWPLVIVRPLTRDHPLGTGLRLLAAHSVLLAKLRWPWQVHQACCCGTMAGDTMLRAAVCNAAHMMEYHA